MNSNGDSGSCAVEGVVAEQKDFKASVNDGLLLVNYAAREGLLNNVLYVAASKIILKTNRMIENELIEEGAEGEFFVAFSDLCALCAPVSPESLEATNGKKFHSSGSSSSVSLAERTASSYRNVTFAAVVFLLVFQAWWVLLDGSFKAWEKVEKDFEGYTVKSNSLGFEYDDLSSKFRQLDKAHPNIKDEEKVKLDEYKRLEEARLDLNKKWDDLEKDGTEETLKEALIAGRELLGRFLLGNIWPFSLFSNSSEPNSSKSNPPLANNVSNSHENAHKSNNEKISYGDKTSDNMNKPAQPSRMSVFFDKHQAVVTLTVLSVYILPMLYGVLGACAYILRTMGREINARTFTNGVRIGLELRLVLGGLSGFSIAWFGWSTDNMGSLTVTPFAIAFLAGYSVELFFSTLDTFVDAFTVKRDKPGVTSPPVLPPQRAASEKDTTTVPVSPISVI